MNKEVLSLAGYDAEKKVTPKGEASTLFKNWVSPANGDKRVYRSAQPNYEGKDTRQLFTRAVIKQLIADEKIKHIVSLNEKKLAPKVFVWLQLEGVKYTHVKTADYGVPDIQTLKGACVLMDATLKAGDSVLVYCGFGQGRTGMMVTAYKIYDKYVNNVNVDLEKLIEDSTAEEDEQEVLLRALAVLLALPKKS